MCVCVYVCVCACVRACVRACVCVKSIYCLDDNKPQGDVKFVCDDTQPSFHPTDNEGVVMVWVNEGVAARQYVRVCQDGSVGKQRQQYAINESILKQLLECSFNISMCNIQKRYSCHVASDKNGLMYGLLYSCRNISFVAYLCHS